MGNPQELGYNGGNLQRLFSPTSAREGLVKPVPVGDTAKLALGLQRGFTYGDPFKAFAVYLRNPTDGKSLLVASRVLVGEGGGVGNASGVIPSVAVVRATVPEDLKGSDSYVFQDRDDRLEKITFPLEGLVNAREEMDPLQHPEGFAGQLLGEMLAAETSFGAREIDFAIYKVITGSSSETPPDDSWQSRRWRT